MLRPILTLTPVLACALASAGDLAGRQLLVIGMWAGDTEVFIVDPETGDARNLSRSPGSSERYASWSPDGARAAFTSDRDGTHNIFIVNADGTGLRQLTQEKAPVVAGMQSWTADGRWIYFGLFGKGEPRMCRMTPDGSGLEEVGEGIDPAVSPDGKTIAFARKLEKGHCLFAMDVGAREVRRLTFRENEFAGVHATWTPDGKRIIYADRVGDALELFSVDPDGKDIRQLTSLGQAATSPSVSPDGKWISFRLCDEVCWRDSASSARAYKEKRADKRPVWVMGPDGSNPHVIETLHYQVTIDGSRAAWRPPTDRSADGPVPAHPPEAPSGPAPVAAATAEPLAVFECREDVGRDWPRTLVTYQRDFARGQAKPGYLRLLDGGGKERPLQLWRVKSHDDGTLASARISFFAELHKGESYRHELLPGIPAAPLPAPWVQADGAHLLLGNGLVALRLPPAGEVKFPTPLSMAGDHATMLAAYGRQAANGVAPGPIQGVRLVDGRWVGGSYFFAARPDEAPKIAGYACRVTEQGPLFTEAEVRYTFTGGGRYVLTARILADDPAIRIDEQFDMGQPGSMWDYRVMISLTGGWKDGGWKPDVAYWISAEERLKGRDPAFQAKLREAGLSTPDDCGSTPIAYESDHPVFDVAVRYPWHPNAQFFGLVRTADLSRESIASGKAPFLAVVPLHAGNWRGSVDASDGMLFSHEAGDLCLNWRLRASPHPRSMLHTGEYDPDQPLTFCRRQWALMGGPFQPFEKLWSFRSQEGCVTLDDYKDWVLDWPADPGVAYPRLLFGREDVERLKRRMDGFPAADQFRRFLYVDDGDARRQELWRQLTGDSEWSSPGGMVRLLLSKGDPPNIPWAVGYRVSQMAGWAGDMDELLSSDKLTLEQRRRLRSDIAALCHTLSEPDINPRGAMTHLGNPNMPINRFCGLAWAAALIPDHPMSKTWLDIAARYMRYKLAMMTAPGGTWGELITYYEASAAHVMQTAGVLARTGRLDASTARMAVDPAIFTLNLLTPRDPRFDARMLPGWGHEGLDQGIQFLVAANAIRRIDPKLAAAFAWGWDAMGRPMSGHHDAGFSPRAQANAELLGSLPADYTPPQLASTWLPGFGATLRSHPGHPGETYLSYHQGYQVSHCDENQGDFTLYAGGAPLVPLSLDGYAIHGEKPFGQLYRTFGFHSRVRFGQQGNTGGWPGGGALGGAPAHGFGPSMDYVRGVGDEGPQRWNRQIAFLKSKSPAQPSYFVFRDSFAPLETAEELQAKWWYLRTLGGKDQVVADEDGLTYRSEYGPILSVRFLEPAQVKVESRDAAQKAPLYHVNASNWRRAHRDRQAEGNAEAMDAIAVNAVGPIAAGQDVLVALYPHAKDQAPPRYEPLAGGVARITTAESVDHVFLGRQPLKFAAGGVTFEGIAGAIRVYPDEVHLIIGEGPACVGFEGTTLRSDGPAMKVIAKADLTKKEHLDIPSPWKLPKKELPSGCRVEGPARCELSIAPDRISGKSEGFGGFLYAPMPPEMKVLPTLAIDGQTYAPGTSGSTLIIPLMPGEHTFEARALEQPPIFRNWQAW